VCVYRLARNALSNMCPEVRDGRAHTAISFAERFFTLTIPRHLSVTQLPRNTVAAVASRVFGAAAAAAAASAPF
jgi:hypothetical protein